MLGGQCVKVVLSRRQMTVGAARKCTKYRKEYRALVHMLVIENDAAILTNSLNFFQYPASFGWLITWCVSGGPLHDEFWIN